MYEDHGAHPMLRSGKLFDLPGSDATTEIFSPLLLHKDLKIERIVSSGQTSPAGFWYDQSESEFVVVIAGKATLRFEKPESVIEMAPGDWVDIPPHCRHRVEWTQAEPPTIWLAIHYV
jgi:cupin 2 domain-containing protein